MAASGDDERRGHVPPQSPGDVPPQHPRYVPPPPEPDRQRVSRRAVLRGLTVAGVVGVGGSVAALSLLRDDAVEEPADAAAGEPEPTPRGEPEPTPPPGPAGPHELDEFAEAVQSGGPPPDGIPPIDEPVYVSADDAGFLDDADVVFGLVVDGEPRAYAQLILVWHEIVNERDSQGPIAITYCPLTGSTVGFRPHADIEELGTSGNLVNSNLLMYDRTHESTWPQILGQAIEGPRRGDELEEFPVEWTTWGRWREAHRDTRVLSTETGYIRDYGRDPYGSYNPLGGYYGPDSDRVMFPLMHGDDSFPAKEVFFGAKLADARLAVRKSLVKDERVVATEAAGRPVAFLYDPELDTGRAFVVEVDGERLDLSPDGDGTYRDAASGTQWSSWGEGLEGALDGRTLERVHAYDVMWFAWAAFFPHTEVVA
jgi:hypothetical protein